MTGDLNFMMELRNRQIMKEANTAYAESVGVKAELGWFDTEFTMYGCAYWAPAKQKRYFKISSKAEDIYRFIEDSMLHDIFPSNVMQLTETCAVPSGMKEVIAQDIKRKLAKRLRDTYPAAFYEQLHNLAEHYSEDSAASLLEQEKDSLEGLFDNEKLTRFVELVQYAYRCRTITCSTYQSLMNWVKEERKNMDDDFISKDIFEKTMYGIAYEEEGTIRYMENAQSEAVYENLYALEQQGVFVTPVFSKTFWYNYEYRLRDGIKDYKTLMRRTLDTDYQNKIKEIKKRSDTSSDALFQEVLAEIQGDMSGSCVDAMRLYGYRWGVL